MTRKLLLESLCPVELHKEEGGVLNEFQEDETRSPPHLETQEKQSPEGTE